MRPMLFASQEMLGQYSLRGAAASSAQKVFVVQPYERRFVGGRRMVDREGEEMLGETLALVNTLGWQVAQEK